MMIGEECSSHIKWTTWNILPAPNVEKIVRDDEWIIDDEELYIMQELWSLVEQARAQGRDI